MAHDEPNEDRTRSFVALAAGTTVSHYRIIKSIGSGGMGVVYLAEDTVLDRKVALKFLPAALCQDKECRDRFKREAQAAAKLDHSNIVTIHDVSEYQGRPFIAMQYVSDVSLKQYMQQNELSLSEILNLAFGISDGLLAALTAVIGQELEKQRHHILKQFSLDDDESALSRLVDEMTETSGGLRKELQEDQPEKSRRRECVDKSY